MVYDTLRALRHLHLPRSAEGELDRRQRPTQGSSLTSVILQHKGEVWGLWEWVVPSRGGCHADGRVELLRHGQADHALHL